MKNIIIIFAIIVAYSVTILPQDDWTLQTPPVSPSARGGHGMAYIGDDKVLMFGGTLDLSGSNFANDTWVYDLSDDTWTLKSPTTAPSVRYMPAMAYIGDDKVVLFGGGFDFELVSFDGETWIYDLSDDAWTLMTPSTAPSARSGHGMAFVGNGQVFLYGGFDENYTVPFDQIWVYDLSANNWTLQSPTTPPSFPFTSDFPIASLGGDQVLFLGLNDPIDKSLTWLYDLSDNEWYLKNEVTLPTPSNGTSMTHIAGSDWVLLFGGDPISLFPANGTFIYDLSDNTWSLQSPTNTPDHRSYHTIADIGPGKVVMFGGLANNEVRNDTWVYAATLPVVTHTILATAGTGGSITPSGPVVVNQGDDQSFTITPDANYEIEDVLVDGISVGSVVSYEFEDVIADHTIAASFSEIQLPNNAPAFISTTPECSSTINVDVGSPVSFTIAAEDGDGGDVVILSVSGLPSGSSMDPVLPTQGNPVSSMFNWTPGSSDVGSHQIIFTAADILGEEVICTLTVEVADVPPPPTGFCPLSQGFWKNHSSEWSPSALPMMLGTLNTYDQSELLSLFNAAPRGDASIILAHQLMAAKLNVANGSPVPSEVQDAIEDADAAIGSETLPMNIKGNHPLRSLMISLAGLLDDYNNTLLTPNCVQMGKTGSSEMEPVTEYALFSNYPNPFNPSTKISWQAPVDGHQTLKVFDVLGNEVAVLVDEFRSAGRYEATFEANNLASGIYIYKLQADGFVQTKKMILLR